MIAATEFARADSFSAPVSFQEQRVEGLYRVLEDSDELVIFNYVFEHLPKSVFVYPSENYYYFSFLANGQKYMGNLRLSPEERDDGHVHFAYFIFNADPQHPDDFKTWYRLLGESDGVDVTKVDAFTYRIRTAEHSVTFRLAELPQTPPPSGFLRDDERFLQRTWDESGLKFLLTFDDKTQTFHWNLDEAASYPLDLVLMSGDVEWDPVTGFVFYNDKSRSRRILIGVSALNTKQNNYFDGPFDQLADNYMQERPLGAEIEAAYRYTQGRVDKYGVFTDVPGSRVAITPYYSYEHPGELLDLVDACRYRDADEFFSCISYDYKRDVPAADSE